ncbi:MAG: response regulator [Leptospiraceae bacterium]|nr:response regulator transcription factor [Leptospiraceae bacterium]MCK6381976.1 response regulator [Leptospiraceae bacterium]NUM42909.1 response regulator transcription factor [Leptospiraceae bacterium]
MPKKILIIDDNDRYAINLETHFKTYPNIKTVRAKTAKEGFDKFQKDDYHTIISDITMETQISGFTGIRKIFKAGYKGNLILATTAFDVKGTMSIGKYFLPLYANIGWMIPKVPLKKGEVIFVPTTLKKNVKYESLLLDE